MLTGQTRLVVFDLQSFALTIASNCPLCDKQVIALFPRAIGD